MIQRPRAGTAPLHLFLLVIMGSFWGLQFAMLKKAAAGGFAEVEILTISLAVIAAVFSIIVLVQAKSFRPKPGHLLYFAIGSFLGYILPLGVAIYISQNLTAGLLTFIGSLSPILTIGFAAMLRTEKISRLRVLAMVLGMAAALTVFWPELVAAHSALLPWLALALLIPVSYSLDVIYIGAFWPPELEELQVVAGEATTAALMLLPFFLIFGDIPGLGRPWSDGHWGVAVFTLCGVIEVMLFFYLVRHAGAVLVSFGSLVALFAGIGWGMVIFSEQHGFTLWIAVGLLSAALVAVGLDKRETEDG
ncbi:MAG: DMT family transporter [Pseudomonadota bacterium]